MSFSELGRIIDQIGKDRGIRREVIIEAIEQAFVVAARKKFGIQGEYEAKYNEEDDEVEIYQYKTVVADVKNTITEITYEEALQLGSDCDLGDQLGIRVENPGFTRVDVQTAKQIIFQKVRDAEREILFKAFKHREGEIITGIARRYERGNVIVDLGKADAILPKREIVPGENFHPGDRLQAYLSEVVMTVRGPEIRLSRTSPMFLVKLFEVEVPEVQDGTIEIKSAAREPGQRAKIAVFTHDKDIDPVGACVGMKGSRVQNVVNELQGEKIDIIRWSEDSDTFIRAALAPAEIESVHGRDKRSLDVIVEDSQLSLAIGRRGQNVRLAAMLSGKKINIISKTKLQTKIQRSVQNLLQVEGITEAIAQMLVHAGIMSLKDFIKVKPEDWTRVTGLDEQAFDRICGHIKTMSEDANFSLVPVEEEIVSASAVPNVSGFVPHDHEKQSHNETPGSGKFSEAEKRLREELAAFKLKT